MPRKNIRPFGPFAHGLLEIKLGQLLACPEIDRVVLSTNDEEILDFARSLVSGGDQAELREIFAARGLDGLSDGGIFGSPDRKDTILARELGTGTIRRPPLFPGGSRYDHEAAVRADLDFVFVSGWSEMSEWQR
ncbi:hypothetical protein [Rhodovulum adriaticum]|uniref:Uncharacterized protein n=1 Tax=Rhodovulum adriaticum TaxID=35804 RepID=A0A4V2SKT0_RHOAD|nr:hypothetical protein [Rhodovulum adriaticum]TCP20736.1 hypothetical protein EV656_1179 [Rhodovulum adriaticum]